MKKNDVVKILAITTYHLWLSEMKASDDTLYYDMTHPKVGDMVMEVGTLKREVNIPDKNDYHRRIGTLIEIKEDQLVIDDLSGKRTNWRKHSGNYTQFIVIPCKF